MPEFYQFFDAERMAEFWYYVKWFLFLGAPLAMIIFAVDAIGLLVSVLRKSLGFGHKVKDDDDDDYDVYRY